MLSVTKITTVRALSAIAFFLSSGFALAVTNNENPAYPHTDFLAYAVRGDVAKMEALIAAEEDFNINHRDGEGFTALDWAILHGRVAVVQRLLEQPEIELAATNSWGLSPEALAQFLFRVHGSQNYRTILDLFHWRSLRGQGAWVPYYNERPMPSTEGSEWLSMLKILLSMPFRSML